jgi:hypothetical protein
MKLLPFITGTFLKALTHFYIDFPNFVKSLQSHPLSQFSQEKLRPGGLEGIRLQVEKANCHWGTLPMGNNPQFVSIFLCPLLFCNQLHFEDEI